MPPPPESSSRGSVRPSRLAVILPVCHPVPRSPIPYLSLLVAAVPSSSDYSAIPNVERGGVSPPERVFRPADVDASGSVLAGNSRSWCGPATFLLDSNAIGHDGVSGLGCRLALGRATSIPSGAILSIPSIRSLPHRNAMTQHHPAVPTPAPGSSQSIPDR